MKPYYENGAAQIFCGDCREVLPKLPELVDATVCDPPYGLSFMGKGWDRGVPGVEFWQAIIDAMKPGAHLVAFGGTRTFHRLMCAIEDAGFEIRDCLMWVYGSGFPKSLNVSKAIDKAAGAKRKVVGKRKHPTLVDSTKVQRQKSTQHHARNPTSDEWDITAPATDAAKQWEGWGTALKPAWEPIILARKPLEGTVAANVLKHGTGALNIDATRIAFQSEDDGASVMDEGKCTSKEIRAIGAQPDAGRNLKRIRFNREKKPTGRWPANLIHDGSQEVFEFFPKTAGGDKRGKGQGKRSGGFVDVGSERGDSEPCGQLYDDKGSAARFFYCAKTSKKERGEGNDHPTVKPIALMRYLCRLVTPPGGVVCDPFCGSGSTLVAAQAEHFRSTGIELESKYCEISVKRLSREALDSNG